MYPTSYSKIALVKKNINIFCTVIADKYKGIMLKPQCLVKEYTLQYCGHPQTINKHATVFVRLLSSFSELFRYNVRITIKLTRNLQRCPETVWLSDVISSTDIE